MESKSTAIRQYRLSEPEAEARLREYSHHLTLGELLKRCEELLKTMPSDTIVLVERVEDAYYDGSYGGVGWDQFMSPHIVWPDVEESLSPAWTISTTADGSYPVVRLHY